ncbi:helix-turn-helix domain-containing protein [Nocardia blacklockiae]|uniref:helix-turn-helix domain-containing protein n=1 Tax=Nocardia blacklockiae TaxID=480036 RepID=UPI001894043F|nr:helix-turn-helix transcriptional regulator [Nocardia blacklockiae]MBF6171284.1 helix-turn-helix domain-containing protein [Nocardia blacklockiae]
MKRMSNNSNDKMGSETTPLGELLKMLREKRGLTHYALQERSGIDRSNLRRIESGILAHVKPATLERLADALDVDVEDFYEAHWETTGQPLPSIPTYFRTKHRYLTDGDIAKIEEFVQRTEEERIRTSGTSR